MTQHRPPASPALAELREHTGWLARDLAGPLRRVSVQSGDMMIEVEWQPQDAAAAGPGRPAQEEPKSPEPAGTQPAGTQLVGTQPAGTQPAGRGAGGFIVISSPMVGTLYRAPSQDAAPFVEVGDAVEVGQTVAIVEAMKLFNPITAELPGIVAEVLAGDGEPVQFGQPLFRLTATSPDVAAEAAGTG